MFLLRRRITELKMTSHNAVIRDSVSSTSIDVQFVLALFKMKVH